MAIFNDFYPLEYYNAQTPLDIKERASASCIVCAEGQAFLDLRHQSLKTKTSGYYYTTPDPRYPGGGQGTLCTNIAEEVAVWVTGTAFAINQNTFFSARHVVEDVLEEAGARPNDFRKLRLVSGFFRKSSPHSSFDYKIIEVEHVEFHPEKDICRITTKQSSRTYFDLASTSEQRSLKKDGILQMVGYPLGQAMKYSEGKIAQVDGSLEYLRGWISYFPGNSGSPVLNAKTGNVVGMLLRGPSAMTDWALRNHCYGYMTYPNEEQYYGEIIYAENFF